MARRLLSHIMTSEFGPNRGMTLGILSVYARVRVSE